MPSTFRCNKSTTWFANRTASLLPPSLSPPLHAHTVKAAPCTPTETLADNITIKQPYPPVTTGNKRTTWRRLLSHKTKLPPLHTSEIWEQGRKATWQEGGSWQGGFVCGVFRSSKYPAAALAALRLKLVVVFVSSIHPRREIGSLVGRKNNVMRKAQSCRLGGPRGWRVTVQDVVASGLPQVQIRFREYRLMTYCA
ncbi:hypothetical protein E2C01_009154 [Portunus trituberculatus]|uniref:Uncharacterized protein n=1 Tax=Portunus trituberculatus TaxID=210409 RepID=A0A5B7D5Q0_PORTR|nr:hypothetical protein [Portunus trituberculatus]